MFVEATSVSASDKASEIYSLFHKTREKEDKLQHFSMQLGQGVFVPAGASKPKIIKSASPLNYIQGRSFLGGKEQLNGASFEFLKMAKENSEFHYNKILPEFEKIQKYLESQEKDVFDKTSLGIVVSYLTMVYTTPPYDDDGDFDEEEYGKAYKHFLWNYYSMNVQGYFEICLKMLPQDIVNELAENSVNYFTPKCVADLQSERNHFKYLICKQSNHASDNMLFAGALFNDATMMERCLRNEHVNPFIPNNLGVTALQLATKETIEKLMKAEGDVLNEEDLKFDRFLGQQREKELDEFSGFSPRIKFAASKVEEQRKLFPTSVTNAEKKSAASRIFNMKKYLAYEENLVRFKDVKMVYNANYVLDGLGVAAEGPQEKTQAAFWQMVWESGTNAIVMLNELNKSSKYFQSGTYGNITVRKIGQNTIPIAKDLKMLVVRELEISCEGKKRLITHWQVDEWPDCGVVPATFLASVIKKMAEEIKARNIIRVAVHCLAGIGRTGVFFAALKAYLDFLDGHKPEGLVHRNTLRYRTKERNGGVQTRKQYALVYSTFAILQSHLYLQSRKKHMQADAG